MVKTDTDYIRQNIAEDNSRKWYIKQSLRTMKEGVTCVIILPQRSYWEPIKDFVLDGLGILLEYGTLGSGDLEYITKEGTRILVRDDRQVIQPSLHTIKWRG